MGAILHHSQGKCFSHTSNICGIQSKLLYPRSHLCNLKIMAGLLDQYLFANNTRALRMVIWRADYFTKRVKNVILKYTVERHWQSLNEETGGMNDVLYKLYYITV